MNHRPFVNGRPFATDRRRRTLAALTLAALGLTAACTDADPEPYDGPAVAVRLGSPDEGADALLTGELTDTGGCLTLTSEDQTWVPLIPERFVDEAGALVVDGTRRGPGDAIALGGGEYPDWQTLSSVDVPEACHEVELGWLAWDVTVP